MNEIAFHGAQKRIDFYGRWGLAFFTVFIVLTGWLGARYEAEKFGILFGLGAAGLVMVIALCFGFSWAAHQHIKQLEEHKDE